MKSFLTFLFIFSVFALFSGQNKELTDKHQYVSDSTLMKNNYNSEIETKKLKENETHPESEKVIAKKIIIVNAIDRILNYKVNRVWREDLYCLVCKKNYASREIA
ncbi:hypothetical protein [Chryseobacterium turcicum]|uniref:Uncharacterized protein n=1 Tax=Chryseobacterium turcicum TaxID=2898076 RepID=A0A9Q3YX42_9FLAO|nr:hypothetical protein [Chryseobacterium turcicum]MCD1118693.1 hypothetical protein [Chryseobacterium turcicum]